MNENEKLASLKTMAALSGVDVNVKSVCDDWLLLTFDIPATIEGNKARQDFYKRAKELGATQHSESVYLLPWCPETELLALDISKVGDVYVWVSHIKDEQRAQELTSKYDTDIEQQFKALEKRIAKMKQHLEGGKEGTAKRMVKKTNQMINDLTSIVARRGSTRLADRLDKVKEGFESLKPGAAFIKEIRGMLSGTEI